MTPNFKKSFINGNLYKQFSNSASEMFDFTMTNIMDGFYNVAMNLTTDGSFKAICLSGVGDEDNTGASPSSGSATVTQTSSSADNDVPGEYINIIVRPLTSFGSILPDPRNYKEYPDMVNNIISIHGSMYLARSDFEFLDTDPISFGQVVDCYFEKGSISNSDFTTLRFSQPNGVIVDSSYSDLATIEGVSSLALGEWSSATLLGAGGIDPRYPPKTGTYIGTNATFNGQLIENGNLPTELMGKANVGKYRPLILAEIVPFYDKLATGFKTTFPGYELRGSGYRSYEGQLKVRIKKPKLAAVPGTSNHGWGLAIDMSYSDPSGASQSFSYSGKYYKWLLSKQAEFGFINPEWARENGTGKKHKSKKEEPWHWEFKNKKQKIKGIR